MLMCFVTAEGIGPPVRLGEGFTGPLEHQFRITAIVRPYGIGP